MSNLRDDWVVSETTARNQHKYNNLSPTKILNLTVPSEEGDPVFSCYFKTELSACLMQLTRAQISLIIAPQWVHPYIVLVIRH